MKKSVLVHCNNYLGFTLLSSGGVLEDMAARYDVTILTVPSTEESVKAVVGETCRVLVTDTKTGSIRKFTYGLIGDILGMTYAQKGSRRNLTGVLHRKAHLKLAAQRGLVERIKKHFIVLLSRIAERSKTIRSVLNTLFYYAAPTDEFSQIFQQIKPVLAIATTAGLGKDGVFFAASHKAGVPCLAMIQSWDRTASKGYPACHPDYCIVWNEPMADEAEIFLDLPRARVFVEGAPPWDDYLLENSLLSQSEKEKFFKAWNLDISKKLIFVALNGPATHGENLRLIRDLSRACECGDIVNAQIMLRTHPAYLVDRTGTEDLVEAFRSYNNPDVHLMQPIVRDPSNKDYVVTDEDRQFMHSMFRACDATASIMSTWMIESSIFDKPNVCIEYGRYTTQLYDFDLSEYKAEHITRIFSYGAVHRVRSPEDLIRTLNEALRDPSVLSAERKRLVGNEVGPHHGRARAAFSSRIEDIISGL